MLSIAIVYRADGGRPLSLGETNDMRLLREAAAAVVSEAREAANRLDQIDPVLGQVQTAEAEKLERVLGLLLTPEANLLVC